MSNEKQALSRPMKCAIFTASDTRTEVNDTSGDLLEQSLTEKGHFIVRRAIIREDLNLLSSMIKEAVDSDEIEVVLITGGTGITQRDLTPEAILQHSTKEIPGFGELFRWLSFAQIGSLTIQSRACAHLCHKTLVFGLPGSPNAVSLALDEILIPQLDINHKPCNFAQLLPRI
jgi:molybdenum cofactor biosynthesis protein B